MIRGAALTAREAPIGMGDAIRVDRDGNVDIDGSEVSGPEVVVGTVFGRVMAAAVEKSGIDESTDPAGMSEKLEEVLGNDIASGSAV